MCELGSHSGVAQVWHRIQQLDYYFPDSPAVSESCKELIRLILVREPSARLTIAQIQVRGWRQIGGNTPVLRRGYVACILSS
jgi:hypothetical protein